MEGKDDIEEEDEKKKTTWVGERAPYCYRVSKAEDRLGLELVGALQL